MNKFKYFKGPSKEKILKRIEGLSLEEKLRLAIENNCVWMVKDCLNKNPNLHFLDQMIKNLTCNMIYDRICIPSEIYEMLVEYRNGIQFECLDLYAHLCV
jgi:hypothetical protein